jgi:hypothetical protein
VLKGDELVELAGLGLDDADAEDGWSDSAAATVARSGTVSVVMGLLERRCRGRSLSCKTSTKVEVKRRMSSQDFAAFRAAR